MKHRVLLACLLLWGCRGNAPQVPAAAPTPSEEAVVETELPLLPVPDDSTVPADLVAWVARALADRGPAEMGPVGDDPDTNPCDHVTDAAGDAQLADSGWEDVDWRQELQAARDRYDITCVIQMNEAAGLESLNTGDRLGALDHYQRARYLAARIGDVQKRVDTELDMAQVQYWLGRYPEALDAIERGLPWLERREPTEFTVWRKSAALLTQGRIQNLLGDTAAAIRSVKQSLKAREMIEATWPSVRGPGTHLFPALRTLGQILLQDGRFSDAEAHLQRAIQLRGISDADRTWAHLAFAELYWRRGTLEEAREQLRQVRGRLDRAGTYSDSMAQHVEFIEANVLAASGDLETAVEHAQKLVAQVEAQRALSGTELMTSFFQQRRLYFDLQVRLLLRAGRLEEAFDAVESLRARDLLDSILWPAADLLVALPPAELQRAKALRDRYSALARQGADLAEILSARDALIQFESEVRLAASAMGGEPIGLDAARDLLQPDDLLLSFWPTDEGVVLFVLHGPDGRLRYLELPPRDDVAESVRLLHDAFASQRPSRGTLRRELASLSEFLLHPVARELRASRHVVVAAEGVFGSVPFSALSGPDGLPLIESHSLTHVHSLSVLAAIRERRRQAEDAHDRAFSAVAGPTYLPSSTGRPPLRASQIAAREIATLFRPSGVETLILTDSEASRSRVLSGALSSSRFVHVGAHVELDRAVPDLSAIRLAEVGPDGPEGGALRLRDLRSLRLNADIVTLAGCSSAGELRRGAEGPMAFPRGILHVGADSVLASLWPVREQPTIDLMHEFYRQVVVKQQPPAEALRRAQAYLAQGDWPELRFWSGFVLLGDGWIEREREAPEPSGTSGVLTR